MVPTAVWKPNSNGDWRPARWQTVYLDGDPETGAFVPARERGTIVDDEPDPENGLVYFEREGQILALEPIDEAEPKAIVEGTDPALARRAAARVHQAHAQLTGRADGRRRRRLRRAVGPGGQRRR